MGAGHPNSVSLGSKAIVGVGGDVHSLALPVYCMGGQSGLRGPKNTLRQRNTVGKCRHLETGQHVSKFQGRGRGPSAIISDA